MIYRFRIELTKSDPLVWREFAVPGNYTLYQLHLVIQAVMGWRNSHLFQFTENYYADTTCYAIPSPYDMDEVLDARKTSMKKIFPQTGAGYSYIYDYGDYWHHQITLIDRIPKDPAYCPVCLAGSGACPPEDVGGISGYENMLDAFKTPRHPEKKSYREWLNLAVGEKWRPEFCSVRDANTRIYMLLTDAP
ncbi:hypothetical protein GCM10027051_16620 [Niabella terrae]